MKIDYKKADQIIENIVKDVYKCVLLYGDNNSAVNTKYIAILNNFKKDNYEISDIMPDRLKDNKNLLLEEFVAVSIFANNTLFTLKLLEKENEFTKIIENLFENNDLSKSKNFLVITAGSLDTSSSLRKYAEKSKQIACIACYEENVKNTAVFIGNKLKEFNFIFNGEIVKYLNENIGSNNLNIENEIKKIDLYKGDDRNLTINDVKKCVNDISQINLNDFCNSFCSMEKEKTFKILDKILQENIELIVVIRMMIRYFLQLQRISFRIGTGENMEEVIGKKGENIFWKQQDFVRLHLQKWNLNKINDMLEKLMIVEKNVKFSNSEVEFKDFVLKCFMKFGIQKL